MSDDYASSSAAGPIVVKYGGNALSASGETDPVLSEIAELVAAGTRLVLVHGGGPEIDAQLARRGVVTTRIEGLRVTDAVTLEVTEAVLCGMLNKRLVRECTALGVAAVGISGEDARTLVADRATGSRGEDLGFVGDVVSVNPELVRALLSAGFLPVVAPLAISVDASHAYNVNADLAAAALAGALHARAFVIVTNVRRVLADPADPATGIDRISLEDARAFATSPACVSGMKPKMDAAIAAVESGAGLACICAASPGAIAGALERGDATVIAQATPRKKA